MPDYQLGKIYRLTNDDGMNYYGSSCQPLSVRKGGHLKDFKCWKNGKGPYVSSFKIIEMGNCEIVLCENFPCKDVYELKARERFYIENNECVNKVIPNRTPKEHYQDNKVQLLEQMKQYWQDNKVQIAEKRREKFTCECGGKFTKSGKIQHEKSVKHQQFISLQETI